MAAIASSSPEVTVEQVSGSRHYYADGQYVGRSVTTILDRVHGHPSIPEDVWHHAGERGKAIHAAIHLYEGGQNGSTLDWDALHPEIRPHLEAYESFKAETGWQPAFLERRVVHRSLGYGGTLDGFGLLEDIPTFADWKSGVELGRHGAQLAAYHKAAVDMGLVTEEDVQRAGVYLRNDGTYRIKTYADDADWYDFLAALRIDAAKERWHGNY